MVSTLQQMPTIGPLFIHVRILLEIFCQPLPVLEISSLNLSQDPNSFGSSSVGAYTS